MTIAVALLISAGCRSGDEGDMPDRETFVATWVELRQTSSRRPDGIITEGDRERILADHGVTEDQLLRFAEARSRDPEDLQGILLEIASRVEAAARRDPGG